MIQMPQMVALAQWSRGAASAMWSTILIGVGNAEQNYPVFSNVTASLALVIGTTLVGSLIAGRQTSIEYWRKNQLYLIMVHLQNLLFCSAVAVLLALFIGTQLFL